MFEVSTIMYEAVKIADRQHHCSSAPQWTWSMMCGTSNVLWQKSLFPRKNQWEISTNVSNVFAAPTRVVMTYFTLPPSKRKSLRCCEMYGTAYPVIWRHIADEGILR